VRVLGLVSSPDLCACLRCCVRQLERPTFYDNAFYGVPDETTQGLNASALTPLLKDIAAGAGLGVLRLGGSARHRDVRVRTLAFESN
jgi:hypothetical protein